MSNENKIEVIIDANQHSKPYTNYQEDTANLYALFEPVF